MAGPFLPRATFAFKHIPEGYGWTETLWNLTAGTLDDIVPFAFAYAKVRCNLLARNVLMTEIRLSDDNFLRDSLLVDPPIANTSAQGFRSYSPAQTSQPPGPIDTSVNYRLECGVRYRGPIFLGGFGNLGLGALINELPLDPQVQFEVDKWTIFISMPQNKWALKVLNKPGDGAAPTAITFAAVIGGIPTVTSPGHGLETGDFVRISSVKATGGRFSCSNLAIVKTSVDAFTVNGYTGNLTWVYQGGGTVQKLTPILAQITKSIYSSVTHRKRGRVFGQRRGRA